MKNIKESGEIYRRILLNWIDEISNIGIENKWERELALEYQIKEELGELDCKLKGKIYNFLEGNEIMNKIFMSGNIVNQPELRYTSNGTPVCSFDIVVDESYTDTETGKKVENKKYYTIVTWRGQAENNARYLKVGSLINVEGKLVIRESKANGTTYQNPEIHANNVEFLDWKVNKKLMRERLNNNQNQNQQEQSA